MTDYVGIDYSGGTSNYDKETGIHYGVISMNALSQWAWEEFEADYGDPTCGHCGNELVEYDEEKHGDYPEIHGCADYACETCEIVIDSQDAYGDEPLGWYLDSDNLKAFVDSYNDVMIVKSPYYTHAQYCSPCAPGAGHLEHPVEGGPKTYCFDKSWFEDDTCPYPYYSVATGELVYSPDNDKEEDEQ